MELLNTFYNKDLKVNIKNDFRFKHLKKYYSGDAKVYIIEKGGEETATIHKIEKIINDSIYNYDVLMICWGSIYELTPAEPNKWGAVARETINNYDLKNNWRMRGAKQLILVSKLYNNHNKNSFEPGYIQKLYNDKKTRLQQQAQNIRAEKARAEREKKRQEAEATTAQFKKNFLVKLNNIIKAAFEIDSIKPDDRMETVKDLIIFKNRLSDKKVISVDIQKLLLVSDVFKKYTTVCETLSCNGNTIYKTEYTTTLLNYLLRGCYGLMLENFEACNGCDWYNNTEKFEILETEVPADTETIRHNYF